MLRLATPRKYRNRPCEVDGHRFDSVMEAKRYGELKLLQLAGNITGLELQPKFALVVNGEKVATYIADFSYHAWNGQLVVEDVKGVRTPIYRLKKKLLKALTGIEVREVV